MERLTHRDLQELLGAYALDAVDDDELVAVEDHLRECGVCRAEVAEHREMAAALAQVGGPAPDGLWDRISDSLETAPPPMAAVIPMHGRSPRSGLPRSVTAAFAVAAAVIALLGVSLVRVDHRTRQLQQAVGQASLRGAAGEAALQQGARVVHLSSLASQETAKVVLLPDGRGYFFGDGLPKLDANHTYQLWGVAGTTVVSLGVLGNDPQLRAFTADAPIEKLALTDELSPGVVASTRQPVVAGSIQSA
jgi:hypothetical protein